MPPRKRANKKSDFDPDTAQELIEQIERDGHLPEEVLLQILRGNEQPCDVSNGAFCKLNRKDNPNCLCCIVPNPGSCRKKGLWMKEPSALSSLGGDPEDSKREAPSYPVGLRNLGNTCYANGALQCLFAIPSLRHALYQATKRSDAPEIGFVQELHDLFLNLQFGPLRSLDTGPFAKALRLEPAVQQDGQEFFKLLLTSLETFFSSDGRQDVRDVVQRLFRGQLSHVTTCKVCGHQSERPSPFYELTPQVRHFTSLVQSLVSSLEPEVLEGDNQYACEQCQGKVDATRQQVLRQLPPYLCLALQRFYFDTKTYNKLKASNKLAFPVVLDFADVAAMSSVDAPQGALSSGSGGGSGASGPLGPDGVTPAGKYELIAVLIHKGSHATSGHYVAHVRDPVTSRWWRYDDSEVTTMDGPLSSSTDHGTAAAAAKDGGKDDKSTTATKPTKAAAGKKRGGRRAAQVEDTDSGDDDANGAMDVDQDADYVEEKKPRGRGAAKKRGGRRAAQVDDVDSGDDGNGVMDVDKDVECVDGKGKKPRGRPPKPDAKRARASAKGDSAPTKLPVVEHMQILEDGDGDDGGDGAIVLDGAGGDVKQQENVSMRPQRERRRPRAAGGDPSGTSHLPAAVGTASSRANNEDHTHQPHAHGVSTTAFPDEELPQATASRDRLGGASAAEVAPAGPVRVPEEDFLGRASILHLHGGTDAAPHYEDGTDVAPHREGGTDAAPVHHSRRGGPPDVVMAAFVPLPDDDKPATMPGVQADVAEAVVGDVGDNAASKAAPAAALLGKVEQEVEAVPGDAAGGAGGGACKASSSAAAAVADKDVSAHGGEGGRAVKEEVKEVEAAASTLPQELQEITSSNAYVLVYRQRGWAEDIISTADGLPEALRDQVAKALSDFQQECDSHQVQRQAIVEQVQERQAAVRSVLEAMPAAADEPSYWISTAWLESWANAEGAPDQIDNSVLLCPHGRLDPAKTGAMKRISAHAWRQLQESHRGGPELTNSSLCYECETRRLESVVNAVTADDIRAEVGELLAAGAEGTAAAGPGDGSGATPIDVVSDDDGAEAREPQATARGDGAMFYVSRPWLAGWQRRQGASISSSLSPTAHIACPHGDLVPDKKAGRRVAVPRHVWVFLRRLWQREQAAAAARGGGAGGGAIGGGSLAKGAAPKTTAAADAATAAAAPEDLTGGAADDAGSTRPADVPPVVPPAPHVQCQEFPVATSHTCPTCLNELGSVMEQDLAIRKGLEAERNALNGLSGNIAMQLELDQVYYLVPRSWVQLWQDYQMFGAKRAAGSGVAAGALRPQPLHEALAPLLCRCHPHSPMLAAKPPRIANRRGRYMQEDLDKDTLRVVTAAEWQALVTHYQPAFSPQPADPPAPAVLGIQAYLQLTPDVPGEAGGTSGTGRTGGTSPSRGAINANGHLGRGIGDADVEMVLSTGRHCNWNGSTAHGDEEAVHVTHMAGGTGGTQGQDEERRLRSRGDGGGGVGSEASIGHVHHRAGGAATEASRRRYDAEDGTMIPPTVTYTPSLLTVPNVCEETLAAAEREAQEARLVYKDAEFMVEVVTEEDVESGRAFSKAQGVERKSKRSRKNRGPVKLSSTTTLRALRFAIDEELRINPRNQRIYVGSRTRVLPAMMLCIDAPEGDAAGGSSAAAAAGGTVDEAATSDDLTMAQLGIASEEEFRVVNTGEFDNDDYTGILGGGAFSGRSTAREIERGFNNTALTGGSTLQPIAFDE